MSRMLHFVVVHQINIADKLHINSPASGGFQWQVFEPDVFLRLQFRKVCLAGDDVLEKAQLPNLFADKIRVREAQQLTQERVYIHDHPRLGIED